MHKIIYIILKILIIICSKKHIINKKNKSLFPKFFSTEGRVTLISWDIIRYDINIKIYNNWVKKKFKKKLEKDKLIYMIF